MWWSSGARKHPVVTKIKGRSIPFKMELHIGCHAVCMCRKRDLNAETRSHPCSRQFSSIPKVSLLQEWGREQLMLSETTSPQKAPVNQGRFWRVGGGAGPLFRLFHAIKWGGGGDHCDVSPTSQTRKNWISWNCHQRLNTRHKVKRIGAMQILKEHFTLGFPT